MVLRCKNDSGQDQPCHGSASCASVLTRKVSKGSSPNEGNATPNSAASSIKAAQAKRLSSLNEKIPACSSDDLVIETAVRNPSRQ